MELVLSDFYGIVLHRIFLKIKYNYNYCLNDSCFLFDGKFVEKIELGYGSGFCVMAFLFEAPKGLESAPDKVLLALLV
ncbi:hypothetical protein [Helicobacter cetorum]|uniref:Uncharacterized protein n=1 Tax=Helicobacter cetorum (strain ATCC BAA-540 / CCUG 52418 / MIT 99-5656) TaxID=1163745 RepID=I0ERP1_HELCM|nr:hypothetical protein [Helicobacter cetorum]AFI05610.1 hypothetical protein HCD_02970 [Helicobacter cetorum MIT 99-5656]